MATLAAALDRLSLTSLDGLVRCLAVLPGGGAAAGYDSGTLRLFTCGGRPAGTLAGHDGPLSCLLWHHGLLWSGGADNLVHGWELGSQKRVRTLRGHHAALKSIFAGAEPGRVWSLSEDRTLRGWRTADGILTWQVRAESHVMHVAAVTPSWAACAEGSIVSVYALADGARTAQLAGHAAQVWCLLASPASIYTGSEDGTVRLWTPDGHCTRILKGHRSFVAALALTPDGGTLFSASGDGMVRAWRVETGECLLIIFVRACTLAFSPDGSLLLAGCADGTVRRFSCADGALLGECPAHAEPAHVIACCAATGQLWSGSYAGTVHAWRVAPPAAWDRITHFLWPQPFRAAARALLCCVHRSGCAASALGVGGATEAGLVDTILRALAATVAWDELGA